MGYNLVDRWDILGLITYLLTIYIHLLYNFLGHPSNELAVGSSKNLFPKGKNGLPEKGGPRKR